MGATLNRMQIIGRLGQDPKIMEGRDGTPFGSFTVATDESYKDKNGDKVERAEWHSVAVSGPIAKNCGKYLHKGSLVYVDGRMQTRVYTDKNGAERQIKEIRALSVQFLDQRDGGWERTHPEDADRDTRGSEVRNDFMGPVDEVPF